MIVPEEAEIIKRIYREYLEGASLQQIGRGLEADGILTAAGKPTWRPGTIKKILDNEKYIGDALLQKTYTVDFLSKKRVINNGIVPQYYVENSHEAIIPREIYMQIQEEMVRRANLKAGNDNRKRVYSSRYALSGIVICGECGEIYRRVNWNNRGKKSIVWRCVSRLEEKGADCGSSTIAEGVLHNTIIKAINSVLAERDGYISTLQKNIETVLGGALDKDTGEIDAKLEELQNELLLIAGTKSTYEDVVDEIHRLRQMRQEHMAYNVNRQNKRQRIAEMTEFLQGQSGIVTEYDDKLVRRLVERVTVFEGRLAVEFRSGVETEVQI
jgi:hypothetical protein